MADPVATTALGAPSRLELHALATLPEVTTGTDLASALLAAAALAATPGAPGCPLQDGDVLVVSSKLVSKSLGLRTAWSGDRDTKEAAVARETRRVVAERRTPVGTTRVVESEAGPVMAAAGVDASNTGPQGGLLVLPRTPDAAAEDLRHGLLSRCPDLSRLGVVVSDTAGRPWRAGQTDLALGCAGVAVVDDHRGGRDHDGRPLAVTTRAVADELAAAADLLKGKGLGVGAVLVRGLPESWTSPATQGGFPGAGALVRTGPSDWFALGHVEAVRAALGAPPGSPASERAGIPPTPWDGLRERVARALRLAAPDGAVATVVEDAEGVARVRLRSEDRLALGHALARLEVAAFAEGLHSERAFDADDVVVGLTLAAG